MIINELKRIYDENLHKYQDEYNKIIAELKIAASNGRKYITIDKVSPAVETIFNNNSHN